MTSRTYKKLQILIYGHFHLYLFFQYLFSEIVIGESNDDGRRSQFAGLLLYGEFFGLFYLKGYECLRGGWNL